MKKLRVAGVGAGYFSQFHLAGWKAIPEVEYVALCDRDEAKARAYAERFGIPRVFTDAAQMLDAVEPDLFDIVTPPPTHAALVAEAARAQAARDLPEGARADLRRGGRAGGDRRARGEPPRRAREHPLDAVAPRGEAADRRRAPRRPAHASRSGCGRATARGRAPTSTGSRTSSRCRGSSSTRPRSTGSTRSAS